jgi:hypothetical protein
MVAASWAAMLWPEIGGSIGCGVLALLAHLQALRSIRGTRPANAEPCTQRALDASHVVGAAAGDEASAPGARVYSVAHRALDRTRHRANR